MGNAPSVLYWHHEQFLRTVYGAAAATKAGGAATIIHTAISYAYAYSFIEPSRVGLPRDGISAIITYRIYLGGEVRH